jgi:23S rRNA pseudouridine1911/1915/1917 synthase
MDPIPVLHQDDHLLVVDKPAGMLVVPAPGRRSRTVVDLVSAATGERLSAVHRLDEETSGALVLARSDAGRSGMEQLFRAHAVERIYLALVAGVPSPPGGRVAARLQERADGMVEIVTRGGEPAVTHYEVLQRRDRCALVRCRLETGRRNQIRVHMAALGCPVAGDRKYGYRARPGESFRRVMLHSFRVSFRHPVTGAEVAVEVMPKEPELRPEADS